MADTSETVERRNSQGRFMKGSVETIDEKRVRAKALRRAWKDRPDYINDIRHPYIYNSWRGLMFTIKGKAVGISEEWRDYRAFYNDVFPSYEEGLVLSRLDKTLPFSKDNFIWTDTKLCAALKKRAIRLTYNGETKTLIEWAIGYGLSLHGIRCRYYSKKQLSSQEILFGIERKSRRTIRSASELSKHAALLKARKMCSTYKSKDKRKGYTTDIDAEYLLEHILYKPCVYCGTTSEVGADRIDNSMGHNKDNLNPCCIVCNTARNNFFSVDEMKRVGVVIAQIRKDRNK